MNNTRLPRFIYNISSGACSRPTRACKISATGCVSHVTMRPYSSVHSKRSNPNLSTTNVQGNTSWSSMFAHQERRLHTLRDTHEEQERIYMELRKLLPPKESPEYNTKHKWIMHLATHKNAVSSDFVAQLGHAVHLIDVRLESELTGPVGYIPGVHWYPRTELDQIIQNFDKDSLIAIVCTNDSDSQRVVTALKDNGFKFPAMLAGGMKTWKLMGFSTSRDPSILDRKCKPATHPTNVPTPTNKAGRRQMTLQQLSNHIGTGDNIQWIKMAAFMVHGRLSCVDGRDDCGVIGTPGGDMGEFIITLVVAEQLLDRKLTDMEVAILFQRRLDAFGRFYMHTDQVCLDKLFIQMCEDPVLAPKVRPFMTSTFSRTNFITNVPSNIREHVIKYLIMPENIGCGHLKFMLLNPTLYSVRPELVTIALRCFFYAAWDGATECDYVVLSGSHDECGVTNVQLASEVHPFSKIPLIAPSIQGNQVFVNHEQISTYLRHKMSDWILCQQDILPFSKTAAAAYQPLLDLLAKRHTDATLKNLAVDLPIYTLKFDDNGDCEVHYNGLFPGPAETPKPAETNKVNTHAHHAHAHGHTCTDPSHTHTHTDVPVVEYKVYDDNAHVGPLDDIERTKLVPSNTPSFDTEHSTVVVESPLAAQFSWLGAGSESLSIYHQHLKRNNGKSKNKSNTNTTGSSSNNTITTGTTVPLRPQPHIEEVKMIL